MALLVHRGVATRVKTVLIVDDDLGFVFWLGQALDRVGYNALPAKGVAEAKSLIESFRVRVDLLMIGAALPGAAEFAADLVKEDGGVKIVGLAEGNQPPSESFPGLIAWQCKPDSRDESWKADCITLIQTLLPGDANGEQVIPAARTN